MSPFLTGAAYGLGPPVRDLDLQENVERSLSFVSLANVVLHVVMCE